MFFTSPGNIKDLSYIFHKHSFSDSSDTVSLDLGCGDVPRNPFKTSDSYGIDIRRDLERNIYQANLILEPLPFDSNTFDVCTAFDFIEHIPRQVVYNSNSIRYPFIELINEVFRVLKPEGLFFHKTPSYPSKAAFQDPTHVNFITTETFPKYFCEPQNLANALGYGFQGSFKNICQYRYLKTWLCGLLQKS